MTPDADRPRAPERGQMESEAREKGLHVLMSSDWRSAFLQELEEHHGTDGRQGAEAFFGLAESLDLLVRSQAAVPSKGRALGVIDPKITSWNATVCVGHAMEGLIGWELYRLKEHNPFRIEELLTDLRTRIASLDGYVAREWYPAVSWASLSGPGFDDFTSVFDWTIERIRGSNPAG